ncbi:50S ribosomal protein L6 [Candidatus Woesearchaeota archaeon]|nr:50S ribosomal protein L6 [Candidatus Woesearchaeota archaeon]
MASEKFEIQQSIPVGITITVNGYSVTVKGPQGEVTKTFPHKMIKITAADGTIKLSCASATKREVTMAYTFNAHIKNMMAGVQHGHTYKLKVCSGHFPMSVSLSGDTLSVKNFLGEKIPRTLKIKKGAHVKVEGNEVSVESSDKELAGQVAADIEQLTRVTNRDNRIFQDGIYITNKSGKILSS